MKKISYLFKFDLKLQQFFFFLPFIAYALAIVCIYISPDENRDYIFFQVLAVSFCGVHLLLHYSYLFEEGASEILLPYYRQTAWLDLLRYGLVDGLCIAIVFCFVDPFFHTPQVVAHTILLALCYFLGSSALLMIIKNLEITISCILVYTIMEIGTQGSFMPWPHIFFFVYPYVDLWVRLTYISLVIGLILAIGIISRFYITRK
ncbi:hypothetical protein [Rummeliibacillus suwonensis]|uniref:hypothetical protein n=1 Tax=Rummeliibacillus suwonensis TaxID=1306154 RepID=UPI0011B646D6|nr:hypothetical protein [Rummeliibacillus suwonensis]